jgi:cytochrome bd-type quinol oxidase subunit 2
LFFFFLSFAPPAFLGMTSGVLASGPPPTPTTSTSIDLGPHSPVGTSFPVILCNIAEAIFAFALAAAVIAFLIAAFRYLTSGGNEQQIARAKDALQYVLFGVAVAILAWGATMIIASALGGSFQASCP